MNTDENLEHKRHSLAHLLGAAVLELWPETKLTLGPAIDNGFYYDFDFAQKISEEDLLKIEKKMKELLPSWNEFISEEVSAEDAKKKYKGNPYKLEIIDEIEKRSASAESSSETKEKITLYTCGNFTDLCRGGHSKNPAKEISPDSFKLDRIAGAYWRGDEKNKMLTRIYGLAFDTKEKLAEYLNQQEEAKKRDHRKLGKELKLFTISELIGAGLPLMQPNGMIIRKGIEDYLWELHKNKRYQRVWTPHIAKESLYVTSGHAAKFGDELFRVQGKEDKFIMKPMNCPHHMQIFADNQFSYKDMPVRYFEPATVYRDEKSGQLGGLTRVRAITQDDGHLFCRISQIETEVATIVEVIKKFYTTFGMIESYWVSLSVRGNDKQKYLGTDEVWNTAENALEKIAKDNNLPYKRIEGEAAFYGPKLDFMFKDSIGREWQLATIQCDFNLPERFDLSFTNEKGEKERPVVIHRAISGSLERFMGIMIEHYAGAFPFWLSPVQVAVIPVNEEKHLGYAKELHELLLKNDFRANLFDQKENLGPRIRMAKNQKIPYCIVVGDKEIESNTITVEGRGTEKYEGMKTEEFLKLIKDKVEFKS